MQVNLLWTAGASRPAGSPREPLLPHLLSLLDVPPAQRTAREEIREEDREQKQRRREAQLHDLAQAASAAPRPSDVMVQAERHMLPGSRAARQEELSDQARQQVSDGRRDFRQALADAAARSKTGYPQDARGTAADPAQTTKPDTIRSANPPADKPGRSATAPANADASAPAAHPQSAPPTSAGTSPASTGSLRITPVAGGSARPPDPGTAGAAKPTAFAKPSVVAVRATGPVVSQSNATTTGTPARSGSNPVAAVAATRSAAASSTKSSAVATATPEPSPGNSDANIARIVRLIAARLSKDRSVATLRLDPPELGSLRLRLDLRQEQLSLQIDTQTPAARRLLSDQLDVLRRSLDAAGIQLQRVEVRGPDMTDQAGHPATPQQSDSWAQGQEGPARDPTGSAGGGPQSGTDSTPTSPAAPAGREAAVEPAAEPLVNLLA